MKCPEQQCKTIGTDFERPRFEATQFMDNPQKLSIGRRLLRLISLTTQHIAITVSCGLCLMLVGIAFSRTSPWLELLVHFSFHALIATLVVIPFLWMTKHYRTALVCGFVAACLMFVVQPWKIIPLGSTSKPDALRVLSWNMYVANEEFDAIVDVIRNSNPDILVLIEVRPDFLERASWIKEQYPNFEAIPDSGGGGIGVFCRADSKYSVDFEIRNFGTRLRPSIVATLTRPGGSEQIDLVAMHTLSPALPYRAIVRDKQLYKFLDWSQKQANPQCLVGDLNTSPWTQSFLELEKAGFRDSRRGVGNCASWPAWLGWAGIPIDHAMTRGDCAITERKVLSTNAGSDHQPIEFKLSF